MTKSFKEALKARRTFYRIQNKSTLSDKEIRDLIRFAVEFVPSAFNSQTTRVVLLTGKAHEKLWNIVKNVLRKRVPAEVFGKTEEKIDGCFACGYGTILYFEDMAIVRSLQESFPTYKDNFPIWAEQTDAMHQLAVWTMLEDAGMGASLQHYNPLTVAGIGNFTAHRAGGRGIVRDTHHDAVMEQSRTARPTAGAGRPGTGA